MNVAKELASLKQMTVGELKSKYAEVFGESTNAKHREWLIKRILWRMQAVAEGDLSARAKQRAAELANDADLRTMPPKSIPIAPQKQTAPLRVASDNRLPMPGTTITKAYKGRQLEVRILAAGFEFEGDSFKSLSAVAKHITGQHCNGYHFFGLRKAGGAA